MPEIFIYNQQSKCALFFLFEMVIFFSICAFLQSRNNFISSQALDHGVSNENANLFFFSAYGTPF